MRVPRWIPILTPHRPNRRNRRAMASLNRHFAFERLEDRRVLAAFAEFSDPHPAPGNQFGAQVVTLSTGNVVITSPFDDAGGTNAGAVYLFNGQTGALISSLIGSSANDNVGNSGTITALTNGNFVIVSSNWDNGAVANAGAVTWGSGVFGINGVISAGNSLVGSTTNDQIGFGGITVLSNGNYVVNSRPWDNGAATDAGAVTWGNGTTGVKGIVSPTNSLTGSTSSNQVGLGGITALTNGNYVISSPGWDNGAAIDAGAVTWGNGTTGIVGAVSISNSLVGSTSNNQVGSGGITALGNGNYVVRSHAWDNGAAIDAGAVTWGSGITGVNGAVSIGNSLVGSMNNNQVGFGGITELINGNYVVNSYLWDNAGQFDVGAVTWGSGTTGVNGTVSATNSLVGNLSNNQVGIGGITVLTSGNYVVRSQFWDNSATTDVGAVTWGNQFTGIAGTVAPSNSLVGSAANDQVGGGGITALSNGSYVVRSPLWNNGAATDAGAVTWGSGGSGGVSGFVSTTNSRVGGTANNQVGSGGITTLANGNYVVSSPLWDNGAATDAGAVTWGSGTASITGTVSSLNSLVGTTANNQVGNSGVTGLTNGNYVVRSPQWDNGAATDAGAVTWANGTTGIVGNVSAANSIVGSTANNQVGSGGVTPLTNGNYVVRSQFWDNGAATDVGAVTWGSGTIGVKGIVSASNSLIGSTANDGVGANGITVLANGNYLARSRLWDNGAAIDAGAVTWGSGSTGIVGAVSAANSLVGITAMDQIGSGGVTVLANGNYVVVSGAWRNGITIDAGAVTWGSGSTGIVGAVSPANSLVGSTAMDQVGSGGVTALANGNYIVSSPSWSSGAATSAGAMTWGKENGGVIGTISSFNSAIGAVANTGLDGLPVLDASNQLLYARFLTEGSGVVRVGSQVDGFPKTAISLVSGNLVLDARDRKNDFSVGVVGGNLVITDALELFDTPPVGAALSNNYHTLTIPLASITGSITINGADGDDTVTVDLAGGDPLANAGLFFNGDSPMVGSGDTLKIVGGNQGTVTYNYTNAHDGSVILSNYGTIFYTGLESIINSGLAANVIFNLPSGSNDVTLGDDGTVGNNLSRLVGQGFESTVFANPTGTLEIRRGSPSNKLFVNAIPDLTSSLLFGSNANRFANIDFVGSVSLAASKTLTAYSQTIMTLAQLTTSAGEISLSATGDITITKPILSGGGVQNLTADSDGDGSGTLLLRFLLELVDPNPALGNEFGASTLVLTSGNIVVTSPYDDAGGTDAGAVYLFNGITGTLISTLRGSSANNEVGSGGITALNNGNYVVRSPNWDNGAATNAGAVTWGNGSTGIAGIVSASNSLVGSAVDDRIGWEEFTEGGITALSNGNYVVSSRTWDNGAATNAGAVTWGNGTTGIVGIVSVSNSLVGSAANDLVGYEITALGNGNYVLSSPDWDNGAATNAGAVTWGNGTTGIVGIVSTSNSLVGGAAGNRVGRGGISVLSNGNYVVRSPEWDNGAATNAGAVTWANESTGIVGIVSASNSLVGGTADDRVGYWGITALSNGNYVVRSLDWDNGAATNAGAVTWGNGITGIVGIVSASNSLVGSSANDEVGDGGITALSNGNYVVRSPDWDNGAATNAGAVTWGNGTTGIVGTVSASNSLVGSLAFDVVGWGGVTTLSNGNYVVRSPYSATTAGAVTWGNGTTGIVGIVSASNSLVGSSLAKITALSNGNYVVSNPDWNNGAATDAGAVTWANGTTGIVGIVSASNSLVGSAAHNRVGSGGISALSNGNYVVSSPSWTNGAGAVTWGNGTTGIVGIVSASNSLVGDKANDSVGSGGISALSNGNYVISSPDWDNGAATNAGAVTWGNGTTGIVGIVSTINSLVGGAAGNGVGSGGISVLSNGNYVVRSPEWDNGAATNAGAVTWANGTTGIAGIVSASNSLVGSTADDRIGWVEVTERITALSNGNYVISSPDWDNGSATNAGAVTWGNGTTGIVGIISPSNSLVGGSAEDYLGIEGITALSNGNYVVSSKYWDNGAATDAGAVTWANGTTGIVGIVSPSNSFVGSTIGAGNEMRVEFNTNSDILLVAFPNDNGGRVAIGAQTLGLVLADRLLDSGNGDIHLSAAKVNLQDKVYSSGTVTMKSQQANRPINLGTNTAGSLSLTVSALDRISAGTLQIGSATSGLVTVSASINRTAATNLGFQSPAGITVSSGVNLNTAGGSVVLSSSSMTVLGSVTGPIFLTSGSSLKGTGTTSPIIAQSGGAVAPGTNAGILNSGFVIFDGGSNFNLELNGVKVGSQYDQLNVIGSVTLNGGNLNLTLGYAPAKGDAFTIISNDSTDAILGLGTFKVRGVTIPDGGSFVVGSTIFVVDYTAGSNNNDVTLTAIGTAIHRTYAFLFYKDLDFQSAFLNGQRAVVNDRRDFDRRNRSSLTRDQFNRQVHERIADPTRLTGCFSNDPRLNTTHPNSKSMNDPLPIPVSGNAFDVLNEVFANLEIQDHGLEKTFGSSIRR